MNKIILVDMDGVLCDFEAAFLDLWRATFPEKPWIALEDRRTFYLSDQYPPEEYDTIYSMWQRPRFFAELPEIEGGVAAVKHMHAMGYDVRICTAPMRRYEHCANEKFEWVERKFGSDWVEKVIMTRDKTLVRGDVLIDDIPRVKGSYPTLYTHIIYDQPYNREVTDKPRMTWANWQTVLNAVLSPD